MTNQILFNRMNHFHFAVRIRSEEELVRFFEEKKPEADLTGFGNLSGLVSKQYSNFLNSYTKSFNNKYDRKGKLFLNSLERKPVKNDTYYRQLIYYIHQNPVLHGFVKHPSDWPYSSYHIFLSDKETRLKRSEVLQWFGNREAFVEFHQQIQEIDMKEFY